MHLARVIIFPLIKFNKIYEGDELMFKNQKNEVFDE